MTDNTMAKGKSTKRQWSAKHYRILKINQHEPHKKQGVNSGAPKG
jgi:hypothetical protein